MESTIGSTVVGSLADLVTRYNYQVLHGCGNDACTEVTCHTGNTNTSRRPVRRPKPRTARATALCQALSPRPRAHLCKHLIDLDDGSNSGRDEGPRDPSSLIQLLCDTRSVRQLTARPSNVGLEPELEELHQRHASLSDLLRSAGSAPPLPADDFVDNADLVDRLMQTSFTWLIDRLPSLTRAAPWIMINRDIISKGLAYPQRNENMPSDDSYNPWAAILDMLDHGPYLRLIGKTMAVIGRRSHLENVLHRQDPQRKLYPDPGRQSIALMLASALGKINHAGDVDGSELVTFAVVIWLKKAFARTWNTNPVFKSGGAIHGILELLQHLEEDMSRRRQTSSLPSDVYEMPLINAQIDPLTMATSYLDWTPTNSNQQHVMQYPIIFSMKQLSLHFRVLCHLLMRRSHSLADAAVMLRGRSGVHFEEAELFQQLRFSEEHYLLISVSRDEILEDTWTQLWQRRKAELRRPLRVRLGERSELEIGHDLGGVQIEYFNLVCREVFAAQAQMLTTNSHSGISYFRPGSLQPLYMFEMFGLIVALALYNGITLPVRLPEVFYTILSRLNKSDSSLHLVGEFQLQDLNDTWADEVRSLQSILNDEVEDLEYSFPLEANGLRFSVQYPVARSEPARYELHISDIMLIDGGRPDASHCNPTYLEWPGWRLSGPSGEAEVVTAENKTRYVQDYIYHLCYGSVAPQLDAFLKGFHGCGLIPRKVLAIFQDHQLKSHLEGSDHLDIDELKAAARYDGYEAKSKYIQMFWRVVSSWPEKKQKLLLKFVTAAERIPITGASQLTFVIKKAATENLESLPASSTCFGTLILPRYPTAEILQAKLSLALMYGSEGFGTG
ncbi:hypothetical protein DOTSEDRAFT_41268 [Dothistroma septosporum NZE10]|uniref:HECT-type E3 ubiquitin transferase n=1 Tax=Dothistroma septosporum (strain NZE10 / CBS 128990) TaxID=675120 RepID=N1Q5A8_DOTSN|nr:hypothetical protein DOTSEDRAFT_41268 [Dothistroma septosporum NZE10]